MHIPSQQIYKLITRCQPVAEHTINVAFLTSAIIQEIPHMELYSDEYRALPYAALLHDIAKVNWRAEWFYLPRYKIPEREWVIMQMHPQFSAQIARELGADDSICSLIENHHNKIDTIADSILRAADIYAACREERPYRRTALTPEESLSEVRKSVPIVVSDALIRVLNKDNKEVMRNVSNQ